MLDCRVSASSIALGPAQTWVYGDRSVAAKLVSGDKVALLVVGDSRLAFCTKYAGTAWSHIPLAGTSLNPFLVTGVAGAPWTSSSASAANYTPVASNVLPATYIGDYAPIDVGEVAFTAGTAPATDGDGGGTPHNTSSALQFNDWQYITWPYCDRAPYPTPVIAAAFAASASDVQVGTVLYTTPSGVTTADLHLQFRANKANYTESGPYYAESAGFASYSATAGYSRHLLATNSDWVTYPLPSIEIIYTRGAATRTSETLTVPHLWVERATHGVTLHNWSVPGRGLAVALETAHLFPLVGAFQGVAPLLPGTKILWLDLGTNDAPGKAAHKARILAMIAAFRAGTPDGQVLLTTAYPTSANTPGVRPDYAQAAVEVAQETAGVLCIDSHLVMGTYLANRNRYQDTVHFSEPGALVYHASIDELVYRLAV